jgi:hypothetical protein
MPARMGGSYPRIGPLLRMQPRAALGPSRMLFCCRLRMITLCAVPYDLVGAI